MFMTTDEFFFASRDIIAAFNAWAAATSGPANADHVCYRCSSTQEYDHIRALFEGDSAFIYQAIISGRRIATIKFTRPIPTDLGDIWYLELSDQKPDGSQSSGFDHIELAPGRLSWGGKLTAKELADYLSGPDVTFAEKVRPHHTTYDTIIEGGYKVRIEPERLVEKVTQEMLGDV